jgi:membrane protease YdiL (CAAX protease family)
MENLGNEAAVTAAVENDPATERPGLSRNLKIVIIAAVVIAVLVWQACMLRRAARLAERSWTPGELALTCNRTGDLAFMGGGPMPTTGGMSYMSGSYGDQFTSKYDLIALQRQRDAVTPIYRAQARWSTLIFSVSGTSAWSSDDRVAFFTGRPIELRVLDPRQGRTVFTMPLRALAGSRKLERNIKGADVLDWRGNTILCRLSYYQPDVDRPLWQYVLVDLTTRKVTCVVSTKEKYQIRAQIMLLCRTGCLLKDGSVLATVGEKLVKVAPGRPSQPFYPSLRHVIGIRASDQLQQILILTYDNTRKQMRWYLASTSGSSSPKTIAGLSTVVFGPNGEVISRASKRLRILEPEQHDLGASGGYFSVGGTKDKLIVWRWDKSYRLTSDICSPKDHYSLVSRASYRPQVSRDLLFANDWGYLSKQLALSLLYLLLSVAAAVICFKFLPRRFSYGVAAVALTVGYRFAGAKILGLDTWSQMVGVSLGISLAVDVFAAASVILVWFLNSRYAKLSMKGNGWSMSWSPVVWTVALLPIAWTLLAFFNPKLTPTPVDWSYVPALVVRHFAVVALWEEFIFRGILWEQLSRLRVPILMVLQSLAFTAMHYRTASIFQPAQTLPGYFAGIFLFGLIFGFARLRSRSLIPCLVAHAASNVISIGLFPWSWHIFH